MDAKRRVGGGGFLLQSYTENRAKYRDWIHLGELKHMRSILLLVLEETGLFYYLENIGEDRTGNENCYIQFPSVIFRIVQYDSYEPCSSMELIIWQLRGSVGGIMSPFRDYVV